MRVKYMGSADRRSIGKGADFGGQLAEPLDTDIVWDWDNNHVIDTTDEQFSSVDETFWELLLEGDDFKDVTDLKRVPTNLAQQRWKGFPKTQDSETALGADDDSDDADEPKQAAAKASGGGSVSEASDAGGATTTTTGGSTSGDAGGAGGGSTGTGGSKKARRS